MAISTAKRDEARKLWHRLSRVTRALWLDSAASPQAKSQGDFSWKRAFSGAYLTSRRWAVSAGSALRRAGSLLSCRSHHFTHAASLEPDGIRKLVRNLNAVHDALTYKAEEILPIEQEQREKLKYRKH